MEKKKETRMSQSGTVARGKRNIMVFSPRTESRSTLSGGAEFSPQSSSSSASSKPKCVVVKESFKVDVTDPQERLLPNGNYSIQGQVTVTIDFSSSPPAVCSICEYRQEIRGYAKYKQPGQSQFTYLDIKVYGGASLNQTKFQEDACVAIDGTLLRYGHRNEERHCTDDYTPERKTGCHYAASDSPGLPGDYMLPGTTYDFKFEFKGKVINAKTGKGVEEKTWTVQKAGTLPS